MLVRLLRHFRSHHDGYAMHRAGETMEIDTSEMRPNKNWEVLDGHVDEWDETWGPVPATLKGQRSSPPPPEVPAAPLADTPADQASSTTGSDEGDASASPSTPASARPFGSRRRTKRRTTKRD